MVTKKRSEEETAKGFSRRQFLKVAGAGAAAIGATSGLAAIGGQSLLNPEVAHAATHPRTLGGYSPRSLPSRPRPMR